LAGFAIATLAFPAIKYLTARFILPKHGLQATALAESRNILPANMGEAKCPPP
jgi:hypothetical protein